MLMVVMDIIRKKCDILVFVLMINLGRVIKLFSSIKVIKLIRNMGILGILVVFFVVLVV